MTWREKKKFLRITATVFAVMFILVFAFASCASSEKEEVAYQQEEQKIEYAGIEEYEVKAFDTLSGIAVKYIPSDAYMQEWIDDVKRLNGRADSTIYFGEVIKVYVYEE